MEDSKNSDQEKDFKKSLEETDKAKIGNFSTTQDSNGGGGENPDPPQGTVKPTGSEDDDPNI